ncbi:DUF1176 domain-containing protein [Pseudoduganella umbonata]|uniref:DUF1176 domain-containing protein n=1 Tax=Pseudoduganella umbonata TaxID=864828 RepID=A0A4P8HV98_9BURK|nr:DUF1176 domain-containing protein [Pseudoduganella umbonata]MBB3224507.1 hypothetical protein [Pseudoduganella umbonata]QCP13276.1 DUF1176 domain-containing protein [Pseudoduganella umbonata]
MKILLTALLAAYALPSVAGEPAGIHFMHGDWEVACDNTRTCRAAGYHADGDDNTLTVSVLLERPAGPRQPVAARLKIGHYDAEASPPKGGKVAMAVDGRALGTVKIDGDTRTGTLSAAQAQALVAAVSGTGTVQWSDGQRTWALSGSGATAVLLKMDEFQGRLGTTGALLRKGGKGEDGVAAPLPMPEVSPASAGSTEVALPPAARTALLRELRGTLGEGDCEALAPDQLEAVRLTTDRLLVHARCWLGAYNEGTGYWVANKAAPFKPELVTTSGSDYTAGTITSAQKGRGLGDCWASEEWVWDGRRFARTKEATSGMCKLVEAGGAWDLPTYVAKVTRGLR